MKRKKQLTKKELLDLARKTIESRGLSPYMNDGDIDQVIWQTIRDIASRAIKELVEDNLEVSTDGK